MRPGRPINWLQATMPWVAALVFVSPAAAQIDPSARLQIDPGDKIFVTETSGVQTRGRFLRLTAEDLTLLVDGKERSIPAKAVGRIEKSDSLWNGILIGAVPGVLLGAAGAGASCGDRCGHDVPLGAAVVGAMGAGIGALIDWSIHTTVFGPTRSTALRPAPILGPRRVGVALSRNF